MKLPLDENLPKRMKADFSEHDIFTVNDLGWNGKTNGELLNLMLQNHFDILITFDKNLKYQQNLSKYPIPVIVWNARDNTYQTLSILIPAIKMILKNKPGKGSIEISDL